MSEDLTIGKEDAEVPEEELEVVYETTTREEYINCSYAALAAISDQDPWTEAGKRRKKRIEQKCLRIIDEMVSEMYDELFNPDEDETE